MADTFITSTPKFRMNALGYKGIMVTDCFAQLQRMLRNKFGENSTYPLRFAEPTFNKDTSSIDWYSSVEGSVQKMCDLPPDEQNDIRLKLEQMAKELRSYAEELKQSPDPQKNTRGSILELSLRYPDEGDLYVVGEQPVITCWGFGPGTPGVEPQDLCRLRSNVVPQGAPVVAVPPVEDNPPIPEAVPAGVERRSSGGWWWFLPLFILILLLILLFSGFGELPAISGKTLFHLPPLPFTNSSELEILKNRNADIEKAISGLRNDVEKHAADCKPTAVSIASETSNQINEHSTKQDISIDVPSSNETPAADLVIPEDVKDASFIEGHWRCDTGLINAKTRKDVKVEFIFNKDGNGHGITYEEDGTICKGTAIADILNGSLHIRLDEQKCTNGHGYSRIEINCSNSESGNTICQGIHAQGGSWDANFKRVPR